MPQPRSRRAPAASRATIIDVARQAQVSAATVSRVLNESAHVSEDATRAVLRAAARLDFRPNLLGRNLRSSRTHNLGVILPTLAHPVFAECLQGLESAARAGDHAVMLATTGYDPKQEDGAIEALLRHRVDGLVLTVADAARSCALDKLDRERVPYVLVYNQLGRRAARQRPTVSVDNRAAARQMVAHLIALGHRRIAMVAGSSRQSDRTQLRHRGYQDAMRAAGLVAAAPVEVPFMAADARVALQDLLGRREQPTALFCSSDQLAMMVMRDLARLGFVVPRDVSVAGFDGVQLGTLTAPVLSTVVQPSPQIAATAVDLLLGLIGGARFLAPALLHHTLRLGESTAAPASLPHPLRAASAPQRPSVQSHP
ncbi:MAG: LacI family DNA-binding transcriptional regulator [Burkholderiaceae bacterium]|nr:LacI family DNA-binding transcriptional regulator [Burkholderiaceae bacterium]